MLRKPQHSYEFGPYQLDTAERQLYRQGQRLQLTPKAFDTLAVLVERHGRLVEKDELMKAVWPDSFVGRREPRKQRLCAAPNSEC